MPIKLRGRSKYKQSEDASLVECSNHPDGPKPSHKSKALLWRLFSSRRSMDNASPASQPGDISSCAFESSVSLFLELNNHLFVLCTVVFSVLVHNCLCAI